MKFEEDFKQAIKALPESEKDKLLLRLLKLNPLLVNQLIFELLETKTVDEKRDQMEVKVQTMVDRANTTYHSPGYFMMDLRYLSGEINEHCKITKDKFGEVHLNLRMLVLTLEGSQHRINKETYGRSVKLCIYVVAKTFNLLVLSQKLHEDLRYDLSKDFEKLGQLIGSMDNMMRTAIHHGLDVNWLVSGTAPDNLAEIQKELRQAGYLK